MYLYIVYYIISCVNAIYEYSHVRNSDQKGLFLNTLWPNYMLSSDYRDL